MMNDNVTNYPFIGGLIGDDLLRHFNLTINYPNHEIHLLPNSHYTDSFDYAYTGLIVFFIDGRIMVDDVIKGSPAQKAGIKKGDVLVAALKVIPAIISSNTKPCCKQL